jgi:hypothetical protein
MGRPLPEWVASQIGWALSCLAQAGIPKAHPFVERGLAELARRQRPDGSWTSEDGGTHDVGATIEAVKVFKHYGSAPGERSSDGNQFARQGGMGGDGHGPIYQAFFQTVRG